MLTKSNHKPLFMQLMERETQGVSQRLTEGHGVPLTCRESQAGD